MEVVGWPGKFAKEIKEDTGASPANAPGCGRERSLTEEKPKSLGPSSRISENSEQLPQS